MSFILSAIKTITKREFVAYFTYPIAYVFLVIFLVLTGISTFVLGDFFERGEVSLSGSFFEWIPWLYLFLVPAIGMRLWSSEHQHGTIELLLTYPIHPWQALIGKFIAAWTVLMIANLLTFPMLLTVYYLGNPDLGAILFGYIGSVLLAGSYLAVTCFVSACTRNQVVTFIVSAVICLLIYICGYAPVTDSVIKMFPSSKWMVDLISSVSAALKYTEFQKGYITASGLVYFASVIFYSLFATAIILQLRKK